jgi:RNA polymerase sigma-70 factor, ECF subfamily
VILSQQSDPQLVAILHAGDLDALGVLYDRYGEIVYRSALRMLADETAAQELTQAVFITLWRQGAYDPRRDSLLIYLMTTTRSQAIAKLQQRCQQTILDRHRGDRDEVPKVKLELESAARSPLAERVKAALAELPSHQQQVLEMTYYGGMNRSEIATTLKVPPEAVKTRSRQGLINLRNSLKDIVDP